VRGPEKIAEAGLGCVRRRTGGCEGGERGRKGGGVGGTALQAGRTEGDLGAEGGVEYTETEVVEPEMESGVVGRSCGHASEVKASGVDGMEAMGVRGKNEMLKGERREDLGGEGGWSGVTRERAIREWEKEWEG
jgi:hypothetical protein